MIFVNSLLSSKPPLSFPPCKEGNRDVVLKTFGKNSFFTFFILISCLFSDERLRLKKADVLESKTVNGKTVQYLSGDVVITKGELTLTCQEGRYFERDQIAFLFQKVIALQKERTLTCDTLKFFSSEDRLLSTGNSHVWDKDYDLVADSLVVYTEQDSGVALGHVILKQKGQIISANQIEYKKDPDKDGVSYIAIGDVVIKDSSRIANCGKAKYDRTNEITTLEIAPEITENGRILSGEKIILTYHEEELKKLHIPKNAYAKTPVEGYQKSNIDSIEIGDYLFFADEMSGSVLNGNFENGTLDAIKISGMAKTLYHVFDDSVYQGKNNASGDTIFMSFKENDLDYLRVIGGSEGKFTPDSLASKSEFPIIYSANKIQYRVPEKETDLEGKAKIRHDNTDLEAGFITVDWQTNILNAIPLAKNDTINEPLFPILKEKGREPMNGDAMTYNLDTRKGRVTKGQTKADEGYYTGDKIRNETEKIIFIYDGTYTTCELDTAHFHFKSTKMKIIQNDVVIARPIILHLGQVPVFGIPLGIFPHKGGRRHSGWLMPGYGESRSRGQYMNGLGYFWAPNDYWDSKFTVDFGDRQGMVLKINNQYRKRYKYNGSLYYRNQQFLSGGDNNITDLSSGRRSSINARWNHRQVLRNNQSFNANVTYSSNGDYNRNFGLSEAERMDQKAISKISYSKRWPKAKNSISVNIYENRDLLIDQKVSPPDEFIDINENGIWDNEDSLSADYNGNGEWDVNPYFIEPSRPNYQINEANRTLPAFSFRHGQSNLIPTTATKKKWYNTITWNYGLNFTNKERDYFEVTDSLKWNPDKQNEQNESWTHTSSINAPQKLFKYITVNPSLSFKSAWVDKYYDAVWNDTSFTKIERQGFAAKTTGSFSINANTQIYGLLPIPIGPMRVIRHVMSPSLGYSWTPDFTKPLFGKDLGYTIKETDYLGNEKIHDKFAGTTAGSTPKSERKSMNFSVNNIFQTKMTKGDEEKKIDLFSWRMSSNYNFAADSMNLANLRSSVRSKIAGKLNLDLSMTHDFYQYNSESKKRINQYESTPRLTNARFSTGFRFSGERWKDRTKADEPKDTTTTKENLVETELMAPLSNMKNTLKSGKLWSTNVSLSYSYTATNPSNPRKTFWMNTSSTINVTQQWRVSYRARFDLITRDMVSHSFSIHRDLHCWELSLNWTPSGLGQGIYFKLNVKSPTLRDLKIEKRKGVFSGPSL